MDAVGLSVLFNVLKHLLYWRWQIRVSVEEAGNPTTWQFGRAQNSVKVDVANRGRNTIEIRDVRLMFASEYGFPPRADPPAPQNPQLPLRLEPGTAETWHFPAETIAQVLQQWLPASASGRSVTKLRPLVATAVGSSHRGKRLPFILDVNAHS